MANDLTQAEADILRKHIAQTTPILKLASEEPLITPKLASGKKTVRALDPVASVTNADIVHLSQSGADKRCTVGQILAIGSGGGSGSTGAVQKSGDSMTGRLSLLAGGTTITSPLFTQNADIATNDFVAMSKGSYRGEIDTGAGNYSVLLQNAGYVHQSRQSVSRTLTLPSMSGMPLGATYHFANTGTVLSKVNIAANSGDKIWAGTTQETSHMLFVGDYITLVAGANRVWHPVSAYKSNGEDPYAIIRRSSAVQVSNSSETFITYDSEDEDPYDVNNTSNGYITPGVTGKYIVTGTCGFQASGSVLSGATASVYMYKNSTMVGAWGPLPFSTGGADAVAFAWLVPINSVSDIIRISVRHTTTSASVYAGLNLIKV